MRIGSLKNDLIEILQDLSIIGLFDFQEENDTYTIKYKAGDFEFNIKRTNDLIFEYSTKTVHNGNLVVNKGSRRATIGHFIKWINEITDEIKYQRAIKSIDYEEKIFLKIIQKYSKNFIKIYNQARQAEQSGLDEICGLGYRKAFEFLVKDYAMRGKSKEEKRQIRKERFLGKIIDRYIQNDEVKKLAHRASWLGNDHAHYFKEWKRKTLEDLKKLIDLVVSWIELNDKVKEESRKIEKSMPGKKESKKEIAL